MIFNRKDARAFALGMCLIGSPAFAGDAEDCDQSKDLQLRISACSKFIAQGELKINRNQLANYYNTRGWTYDELKDFDKAIADYTQAIRLNPKLAIAYNNRGIALKYKGQVDAAFADFTRSAEIDPQEKYAFANRGEIYLERKQYDKALVDLTQAIRIDGKSTRAFYYRGIARLESGDPDLAFADFFRAIELDPQYANPHYGLARVYLVQKNTYKARESINKAIGLRAGEAEYYVIRAEIHQKSYDMDRMFADACASSNSIRS